MRFKTYEFMDEIYNNYQAQKADGHLVFIGFQCDVEIGDGIKIIGHTADDNAYEIYGYITEITDLGDGLVEYIMSIEVMYEVI